MNVLVAFDKFKDSMDADKACRIARDAVLAAHEDWEVSVAPLTDGGEGFARILTRAYEGELITRQVHGPRFDLIEAVFGMVDAEKLPDGVRRFLEIPAEGRVAVIEMAQASGLEKLSPDDRDPWQATTLGTGELIREAIEMDASAILLGIGGSATNDCGTGALEALGLHFYNHALQRVTNLTPSRWKEVASVGGLVNLQNRFPPVRIACDVTNPLLGDRGATTVYGPQKGLKPEDLERFERQMRKMADRLLGLFGHDPDTFDTKRNEAGSGAAGGIGFGLRTALPDTRYVPGFELVVRWMRIQEKVEQADLILTGEGKFDRSSLEGKGPSALARMAEEGTRTCVLAGAVDPEVFDDLPGSLDPEDVIALSPEDEDLKVSLKEGPTRLYEKVSQVVG